MAQIDGTWNCTMNTPMGAGQVVLTLVTNGDDLSGTLSSEQGVMEFSGGKVDGNKLSWTVSIEQPMPMDIATTATIEGDTLTGEAQLGSFGAASLTGTRAS